MFTGVGQSIMACTLDWSNRFPWEETSDPKNKTCSVIKMHFFKLINNLCYCKVVKTTRKCCCCCLIQWLYIRISSKYATITICNTPNFYSLLFRYFKFDDKEDFWHFVITILILVNFPFNYTIVYGKSAEYLIIRRSTNYDILRKRTIGIILVCFSWVNSTL